MSQLLLIALICQQSAVSPSIAADETILFFPTYARQADDGVNWQIRVHGWIFEPEQDSLKPRGLMAGIEKLFDLDADPAAAEIFRSRLGAFFVDNERNKSISIRIGRQTYDAGTSNENGHFERRLSLAKTDVSALRSQGLATRLHDGSGADQLKFEAATASGDPRRFQGHALLIPTDGISVISDIDDTIKVTEVNDAGKLLENTLLKPLEPVPGMAELYRQWARDGAVFHYVTASPWQLYKPLDDLCGQMGFPQGTWHMRMFRWSDSTAYDLLKSPETFKPEVIDQILSDFPRRRFILVGDSGQRDPEIYGAIARRHRQQIERIFIREVFADRPQDARYQAAFAELPAQLWQVFQQPAEIQQRRVRRGTRNTPTP